MAASLAFGRATFRTLQSASRAAVSIFTYQSKRFLLSQAYSCNDAWKRRLEDPIFSQIAFSEYVIQLRDNFEKQKSISAVDMEILANKLYEMDIEETDILEDVIRRFRKSPTANPVRDAIVYVIVRCYIDGSMADRLIPLMQARNETGIFPDGFAASLLLDHFITQQDFPSAATVAYEMMLQEDFSHPTSRLLALHACIQHLEALTLADIAPDEIKDPPEGEEEWFPVKYIRYPVYDDHFDIKCEQYLLGKTLAMLGRELGSVPDANTTLATSLRVSGLALHHKFAQCLQLLAEIGESGNESVVAESLTHVEESLQTVQVRDPDKPEKETGLLTMDDEIYKLLPTQAEKDEFLSRLQELRQTLGSKGKVVEVTLSALTKALVDAELPLHEAADIEAQTQRLETWRQERQELLSRQLYEMERSRREAEIAETLKELRDKEEMITFFENHDKIRLIQHKRPPKDPYAPKEELSEEELRARRIKRRKFRHNVA